MGNIYFADFETTTGAYDETDSFVYLWGLKSNEINATFHWGINLETFWTFLQAHEISDQIIYFHNLNFDGNFIIKDLFFRNFRFVDLDESDLEDDNTWGGIIDDTGKIYELRVRMNGMLFRFGDSYKMFTRSASDIGKALGQEKLDYDYDAGTIYKSKDEVPKNALIYLERDIDIIRMAFASIESHKIKMTSSSTSMDHFKQFYTKDDKRKFVDDFGGKRGDYKTKSGKIDNLLSEKEGLHVHRSYSGGGSYYNKKYLGKHLKKLDGYTYDENSMYPDKMYSKRLPYGKMLSYKPNTTYLALVTVLIKSAIVKDKLYPGLIKDKASFEARYLAEVENEERVFGELEWNFIKKYYHVEYVVTQRYYFKTKLIFRNGLDHVFHFKTDAQIAGNKLLEAFGKNIYNSLYGKFGQNYVQGSRVFVEDGRDVTQWHKDEVRYGVWGEYTHRRKLVQKDEFTYIPIASAITMYARLDLGQVVFDNLGDGLYSDTDSAHFKYKPIIKNIHSTNLGAGKPEYRFNEFKVLRAKTYLLNVTHVYDRKVDGFVAAPQIIRRVAGLKKSKQNELNFDNFKIGITIKNGKTIPKDVPHGKLLIDIDFTIGKDDA